MRLCGLAEAKLRGEETNPAAYARIMHGLLSRPGGDRVDTIVLACTHFPLVEADLAAAAPRPLGFVHGGPGIARRVAFLTEGTIWPAPAPEGLAVFTAEETIPPGLAKNFAGLGLMRVAFL